MDSVIVVDDEQLALKDVARMVSEALGGAEPLTFQFPRRALAWAQENRVDVAFLDIEMPGMSGLALAHELKRLWPAAHIVFVTSYDSYAVEAFSLHATGYLLKPARVEDVRRELTFIYDELPARRGKLQVRTFGGFEAEANGRLLVFKRTKTKELLALLVDRRGMSMSSREIRAILWEDEPVSPSQSSYYQSLVSDLRSTLASVDMSDVLVRSRNSLAVNPDLIDADSWRYLEGDPIAVNSYRGNYLPSYSWAEGSLESW